MKPLASLRGKTKPTLRLASKKEKKIRIYAANSYREKVYRKKITYTSYNRNPFGVYFENEYSNRRKFRWVICDEDFYRRGGEMEIDVT